MTLKARANVSAAEVTKEDGSVVNILVPASMKLRWKIAAVGQSRPLSKLVTEAVTKYLDGIEVPAAKVRDAASQNDEEATIEELKENPKLTAAYLRAVLLDGTKEEIKLVLWRIEAAYVLAD